jgi:ketosteroid isomerase-like protein
MLEPCHICPVEPIELERVRGVYAAFNEARAPDSELFDPELEWHNAPELPGATVHRGLDAMRADINQQMEAWEERRFEPVELMDAGEHVIVFLNLDAKGKASGVPVHIELAHVLTFRDEKVVRVQAFIDREQALAAAGL